MARTLLARPEFPFLVGMPSSLAIRLLPGDPIDLEIAPPFDTTDPEARTLLTEILAHRGLGPDLVDDDALALLIDQSGGVPGTLLALARDAVIEATVAGTAAVARSHVESAVRRAAHRLWVGATAADQDDLAHLDTLPPARLAELDAKGLVLRHEEGYRANPLAIRR